MQEENRDLTSKLSRRDSQLLKMRDANRNLSSLASSKGLDTRERLKAELEDIKDQLQVRDNENKVRVFISFAFIFFFQPFWNSVSTSLDLEYV